MTTVRILVAVFHDEDAAYVATCAAALGINDFGCTPEEACHDLLQRFADNFDDSPSSPTPNAELVSLHEAEVAFASFEKI